MRGAEDMQEPKVTAVTIEMQKTAHEHRQGIVTDTRRAARAWAADRFGWDGRITVEVDRLTVDGLVTMTVRDAR